MKTASAHGAANEVQGRRNSRLVDANKKNEDGIENFFHVSVQIRILLGQHQIIAMQHPLPLFFQLFTGSIRGSISSDEYEKMARLDPFADALRDSSKASANPISRDSVADLLCRDEPETNVFAKRFVVEEPQNEELSCERFSFFPDPLEISAADNSSAAGKFHPFTGLRRGRRKSTSRRPMPFD